MRVLATKLPGVLLVEPSLFGDARGYLMESYQSARYVAAGISDRFVQDNVSLSQEGVLRGLHIQHPFAQDKLVQVLRGEVFDVAVDVRVGSPTFGAWVGEYLSEENHRQLYVPRGFAHGFVVTSHEALFAYKCTDYYRPEAEQSVRWNDPRIGIKWPVRAVSLSKKDRDAPRLDSVTADRLPVFGE